MASGLTSVAHRRIFVSLNRYGCQKGKPKFLEQCLLKDLRPD